DILERPERKRSTMTTLDINGKAVSLEVPADTPLLWALRDELGLTGTKFGCGMALCGARTVHLAGTPTRACVTPISAAQRKKVTTIGAIAATPIGKRVEEAWHHARHTRGGARGPVRSQWARRDARWRADPHRDVHDRSESLSLGGGPAAGRRRRRRRARARQCPGGDLGPPRSSPSARPSRWRRRSVSTAPPGSTKRFGTARASSTTPRWWPRSSRPVRLKRFSGRSRTFRGGRRDRLARGDGWWRRSTHPQADPRRRDVPARRAEDARMVRRLRLQEHHGVVHEVWVPAGACIPCRDGRIARPARAGDRPAHARRGARHRGRHAGGDPRSQAVRLLHELVRYTR